MAADIPTDREAQKQWHDERLRALQTPDGWLTLAGLIWLDGGDHTVGTGDDCAIRLPGAGRCPTHWGTLQVTGKHALWTDATHQQLRLKTDRDGQPDVIRQGTVSFLLLERNDALVMRVRDEQALTRTGFRGTALFPFDPSLQIAARWDGEKAHFDFEGQHYGLRPQNPAADPLHFVIGDATSGQETYGGGRFLYVPRPTAQSGTFLLDLNRVINPPCAFTKFALCPVPPAENRLLFAVLGGEMVYV